MLQQLASRRHYMPQASVDVQGWQAKSGPGGSPAGPGRGHRGGGGADRKDRARL